jgi:hypothetical protein
MGLRFPRPGRKNHAHRRHDHDKILRRRVCLRRIQTGRRSWLGERTRLVEARPGIRPLPWRQRRFDWPRRSHKKVEYSHFGPCRPASDPREHAEDGAPDTVRTCDPCLRRAVLYPAELRARGRHVIRSGVVGRHASALDGFDGTTRLTGDCSGAGLWRSRRWISWSALV